MAINSNLTLNFASSVGYTVFELTPGDVVFSGGACYLDTGDPLAAAVRTPTLDSSGMAELLQAAPTVIEAEGYLHKFLVSFEDWTDDSEKYYWSYQAGVGWFTAASGRSSVSDLLTALDEFGLGATDLDDIREWPLVTPASKISFLVGMERLTGGGSGSIDLISVLYGSEVSTVLPSFSSVGTLTMQPDIGLSIDTAQGFAEVQFSGGYSQLIENSELMRRKTAMTWTAKTDAEVAVLMPLLLAAMAKRSYFVWTAPGDLASSKWVVTEVPKKTQAGVQGLTTVSAPVMEIFT